MQGKLWKTFRRRKSGMIGALVLLCIAAIAVASPLVSPHDPHRMSARLRLQSPSAAHVFGTDHFGRDILSRVLHGSRTSLMIGFSIGALSGIAGLLIGAASGYFRTLGMFTMRIVDAFMAFPAIIVALFIMAIMRQSSVWNVIIALTVTYTPRLTRTAFALSLQVKDRSFVEAAEALGASRLRILLRHIIPNLTAPLVIQATFTCAISILAAASLDFLGVGSPPYLPSWGGMINEGKDYLSIAPWMTVFPGLFLASLVLSLNLIGDTVRDALDPRFKLQR